MNIWLRNTSLLDARANFLNGHKKFSKEVVNACAGIEFYVSPSSKFQGIVFIHISHLCQKLREKKSEEEAKWLEENCSGVITLKIASVNIFCESIDYQDLGGYSGRGA